MTVDVGAATAAAGSDTKAGAAPDKGAVAVSGADKGAGAAAGADTGAKPGAAAAGAKPGAAGADDGSLLGAGDSGDGAPPASDWPADWRERKARAISGKEAGDPAFDKVLNRLKRYASPETVARSLLEAQDKIRTGQYRRAAPGEDATPEEIAAYRKDAGIPDTADKYDIPLPGGATPTEADKAIIDHFKGVFHAKHIPPAEAKAIVEDFYAYQGELGAARREAARETLINNRASLKSEWGVEYPRNINLAKTWLDGIAGGEDGRNALADLALADGTTLGDHPAFVKLAVAAALAQSDDGTLAQAEFDNGGANSAQAQYDALIKMSVDAPDEYAKPANQTKVMRLAAALSKGKSKAA